MEKLNLRVKSNKISICVNDNGDTITFNPDDQSTIDKFKRLTDLREKKPFKDSDNDEVIYEKVVQYCEKLSRAIDDIFGDGAVQKIFGSHRPTIDLIADFICQLEPFISKTMENKVKSIEELHEKYQKRSNRREITR